MWAWVHCAICNSLLCPSLWLPTPQGHVCHCYFGWQCPQQDTLLDARADESLHHVCSHHVCMCYLHPATQVMLPPNTGNPSSLGDPNAHQILLWPWDQAGAGIVWPIPLSPAWRGRDIKWETLVSTPIFIHNTRGSLLRDLNISYISLLLLSSLPILCWTLRWCMTVADGKSNVFKKF